jgi:hypothetical protein
LRREKGAMALMVFGDAQGTGGARDAAGGTWRSLPAS